jgi:Na+/H+ antiporter NhaC
MKTHYIDREYIRNFFRLDDSSRSRHILNFIMSRLVLKRYAHNSYICHAGADASAMYFIEEGVLSVRDEKGELINELFPGQYFGEYAALTGDKRMADVQARGVVLVFQLDTKSLHALARNCPEIYGTFLKKTYEQATEKYRKIVRLMNARRGLQKPVRKSRETLVSLCINYYLVFFAFFCAVLFCPDPAAGQIHPLWLCSPIVFLVLYIIVSKRILESLLLSLLFSTVMLVKFNFVGVFMGYITASISDTASMILMVVLMGSITRLLASSGSINALKAIVAKRVKTGSATLITSFFTMVFLTLDEYLNILINGICFRPLADQKGICRERTAIVMGMSPMALCIISPISLTGLYLAGVMAMSGGQKTHFLSTIGFNFTALLAIVFILLLSLNKIPLVGSLKKAALRVKEGGTLWPAGTENTGEDEELSRGRIVNLVLPVVALVGFAMLIGTLETGSFGVNIPAGMVVALICMFFLYCFQGYMTPDQFFNDIVHGLESMVAPVIMIVLGKGFASAMRDIGFDFWLNETVKTLIGGQAWMFPALIFGVCALAGGLLDNPWAMYAIGIPLALELAVSIQGPAELYAGAVCGAGFIGNEIALGDSYFIGSVLGINPVSYYQAKLPYVIMIAILAFFAYGTAGYLLG